MQVRIMATRVSKVSVKTTYDDDKQDLSTILQTQVQLSTNDLARLHNLLGQKVALYFVVGSLQAQFDLKTETIKPEPKAETGQLIPPDTAEKLEAFGEAVAVEMQQPKAPPKPSPAPSAPAANPVVVHVEPEMMKKARGTHSAALIASKESKVKKPFDFMDKQYICTGDSLNGDLHEGLECYALVAKADYTGETHTYHKPAGREEDEYYASLRAIPEGFYHGMAVRQGRKECVLVGPPLLLVEDNKSPVEENI